MSKSKKAYLVALVLIGFIVIIESKVVSATTYTANELFTTIVKADNELKWTVKNTFNKALILAKNLKVKGNTTLGTDTEDSVTIKGIVTNGDDTTALQVNDALHLTGTLTLDTPLSASMVSDLPTYTAGSGISITSNQISSNLGTTITTDEIVDGTIVNGDVSDSAGITLSKLAIGSSGQLILANSSGVPTYTTLGGDATLNSSGSIIIASNAITSANISDDTITNADINSSANISATKIAAGLTDAQVNNDLIISGGIINNTAIGATTAATGNFSNLTISGATRSLPALPQLPRTNTVTSIDTTVDSGSHNAITIGTDGFPVISYYDNTTDDLKILKCGNSACSDSNTSTAVDTGGNVGTVSSIAIGTDGFPVVSYYDTTSTDLKVVKCGDAACSSSNIITRIDDAGSAMAATSIVIGTDGFPVISYLDSTNAVLRLAKCGNAACSTTEENTLTSVDATGIHGEFSAVTINTTGFPLIAYNDPVNGRLRFAKCGNAACSSGNTLTTIEATVASRYITIALGNDGLPIISYQDFDATTLKVVKCANDACSASNAFATLDSTSQVGYHASLTIGVDGFPVISYYDLGSANLKLAKCGNASCSSGTTLLTLDSTGDVGTYSAITTGSDGLQIIAYYDATGTNLKVLKAGNLFFTDNWTRR